MQLGPFRLASRAIVAPMAGVTDRPFRQLCRKLGAGMAVSEMVSSNPKLYGTSKSDRRLDHRGESGIIAVQIAGSDPHQLADAALYNVERGAQLIDINMGCPAKKVCNKLAGSALLSDESLVEDILNTVAKRCPVPVSVKIRTGPDTLNKNAVTVAKMAEDAGLVSIAIHGRTRACKYNGFAEYDTIRQVKAAVSIPVVANGDINSPQDAKHVLDYTGADFIMIGRAAQGNPWIFREINHYLETGLVRTKPTAAEVKTVLTNHIKNLHAFYGEHQGVRIARKHIGWYLDQHHPNAGFKQVIFRTESCEEQISLLLNLFDNPMYGATQAA